MKRLIWGFSAVYGAVALVMLTGSGIALLEPAPNYQQSLVWFAPLAQESRVASLLVAGRLGDAVAIERLADLSILLVLFAVMAGLLTGWNDAEGKDIRPRETRYVMALMALFILINPAASAWIADFYASHGAVPPAYSAMPAYWLATMVVSCLFLARYMALGGHDLAIAARRRWGVMPAAMERPTSEAPAVETTVG